MTHLIQIYHVLHVLIFFCRSLCVCCCCSVAQLYPTLCDPMEGRLPCPSPSPQSCSNSCPSTWRCHPTISSSVVPFSSCPQSFPSSGPLLMRWLFISGAQNIGTSASESVLPMTIQDWFPLGLTENSIEPCYVFPCGFPCGSAGKESTCNSGDPGSIPGLEKSPGGGKGYPLQSGLENSLDLYRPWGHKELDMTEQLSCHCCV